MQTIRSFLLPRALWLFLLVHLTVIVDQTRGQSVVNWSAPISGSWHVAEPWSPVTIPNGADVTANINAVGSGYVVTIDDDATIERLQVNSPDAIVRQTNGILSADVLEISSGTFQFPATTTPMTLSARRIVVTDGSLVIDADPNTGRIQGATFQGIAPLQLGSVLLDNVTFASNATILPRSVVAAEGSLQLQNQATLTALDSIVRFPATENRLSGNGTLVLRETNLDLNGGLIESGVQVVIPPDSRDNQLSVRQLDGTIDVGQRGTLWLETPEFDNRGRIVVDGYFHLALGNNPVGQLGAIRVGPTGVFETYATLRLSDLANVEDQTETGSLFFGGTLLLEGQTLDLDALPFRRKNLFEHIANGRVEGADTYDLTPVTGTLRLQDITLGANLTSNESLSITGNLSLDDTTIALAGNARMTFANDGPGDQLLGGHGTIQLADSAHITGNDLVMGPNVRVEISGHGNRVEAFRHDGSLQATGSSDLYIGINRGTIVLDGVSPQTEFRYGKESNNTWANQGTLRLQQGRLELIGSYSSASLGDFQQTGGHLIYGGVVDNQGRVLELGSDRSLQAELLGGTLRAAIGETALISGLFRGDTVLQGSLRTNAHLTARQLLLDNATLTVASEVETDRLSGVGQITLSGGRLQLRQDGQLLITPRLRLQVEGTGNRLDAPVVLQDSLALPPNSELGVRQLVNEGAVSVGSRGLLEVYTSVASSAQSPGRWTIEPLGRLRVFGDLALADDDHLVAYLPNGTESTPSVIATGTFTSGGTLEMRLSDGQRPRPGQSVHVIDADSMGGSFATVSLPLVPQPFRWDTSELATAGTLALLGPESEFIAGTQFRTVPIGSSSFDPPADSRELGFASRGETSGANPLLGVDLDAGTSRNRLTHRSYFAVTEFDAVDLREFREVEIAVDLAIANTGYESNDYLELRAVYGNDQVTLRLEGDQLSGAAGTGIQRYTLRLPSHWPETQVRFTSQSNSSQGAEAYSLYGFGLSGYRQELFVAQGDFNGNGQLDAEDIDLLTTAILDQSDDPRWDYGADGLDLADRDFWVTSVAGTSYGDANLDRVFDSSDFVTVFVAGEYEDALERNSGWATGDWNGDREFNSSDLVWVFQQGNYRDRASGAVRAVPEPDAGRWFLLAVLTASAKWRVKRATATARSTTGWDSPDN